MSGIFERFSHIYVRTWGTDRGGRLPGLAGRKGIIYPSLVAGRQASLAAQRKMGKSPGQGEAISLACRQEQRPLVVWSDYDFDIAKRIVTAGPGRQARCAKRIEPGLPEADLPSLYAIFKRLHN
jgi:hypothetical protein